MDHNLQNLGFLSRLRNRALDSVKEHRGTGLKSLFGNMASLSVLQIANYVLPLIIIPYLVRVLGVEKFGLVMFAQATIQFFIISTDYGFHLSAVREIATNRDDLNKVSQIFSSVMAVKFVLLVLCFGILLIFVSFIDRFHTESLVFLLTYFVLMISCLDYREVSFPATEHLLRLLPIL